MNIEQRAVAELVPYVRNARTHSAAQVMQIAASIREFGWTNPVLVQGNDIIAGHGRVLAAKHLGIEQVPCIELSALTDTQKRAYILADNKLALNAGWDEELLKLELTDLKALEFDFGLVGFSEGELSALLGPTGGLTDPDEVPPQPEHPSSVAGDVWLCGRHRVACGNSTLAADVARLLAGVKPHLMVTDPPYGVDYEPEWRADAGINKNRGKMGAVGNDDRVDWREAWVLFPGDVLYCWHAGRYASNVQQSLEAAGFDIRCQIIWAKDRLVMSRGHYHWQHEPCWYAVRKGATGHWAGDRSQTTLWTIPAREDSGHGHSTQKPVECMRRPVENNSSHGQTVYDPFLGSGTTLIACEQTGRTCYAQELLPVYVDVAVQRWQNFTGEKAVRESDGLRYDETRSKAETDIPEIDQRQPGPPPTQRTRARAKREPAGATSVAD